MSDAGKFEETIDLVRRAKDGDGVALESVLARYYPRVLGLVRSRLGPGLRRHTESVDLVQEAMGEAVGAFDRFDMRDEEDLIRWLAALVENRIRDLAKYHRRQKRDRDRLISFAGAAGAETSEEFDPVRSQLSPLEQAERSEQEQRLQEAIADLEPHYRDVLARRGEGLSWDEVGAALGLPSAGAARMLHARARVALMKVMSDREDDGAAE